MKSAPWLGICKVQCKKITEYCSKNDAPDSHEMLLTKE